MTTDYNIPTFLGQTQPTRDQERLKLVTRAREEALQLVRKGILHPDFVRRVHDVEMTNHVITFFHVVEEQTFNGTITVDLLAGEGDDPFQLRVYFHSPTLYEEDETISVSSGKDLSVLIERGKGLMMVYRKVDSKKATRAKSVLLQVRIEPELKDAFERAVANDDDSQARVIRKLIKYYLGQGPDPKVSN